MKKIIIIEGIDGCGKDFVRDHVVTLISNNVKTLREPDGNFRQILKSAGGTLKPLEEYMTMWIGRFLLWNTEIENDSKDFYIINRSFPSTYAYQIEGRGFVEFEENFRFWKKQLLRIFGPDQYEIIHIYLRVDLKIALERIGKRADSDGLEHFEEKKLLERTRMGYDKYFADKSNFDTHEKVIVINANLSKEGVVDEINKALGF